MLLSRLLPLLTALLLCTMQAQTTAASEALYRVSLPVADQSEATRQQTAREGLARVLIRLSGRNDLATYPDSRPFLNRADRYLSQFHYEPQVDGQGFLLHLQFDPATMDTVLQQSSLPVWPLNRPPLLIWGLVPDGSNPSRLTAQTSEWQAAFDQAALDRGLSLHWQNADTLPDSALLRQRNESTLRQILGQHKQSQVLVGEFHRLGDRWQGQWLLLHNGPTQTLDVQADSPSTAAAVLIHLAADALAEQHSISTHDAPAHSLLLQLNGLGSFEDYRHSQALLRSLASVRSVQPEHVQDDRIDYRLQLNSDVSSLQNELRLQTAFSAQPGNSENRLQYRWNGNATPP